MKKGGKLFYDPTSSTYLVTHFSKTLTISISRIYNCLSFSKMSNYFLSCFITTLGFATWHPLLCLWTLKLWQNFEVFAAICKLFFFEVLWLTEPTTGLPDLWQQKVAKNANQKSQKAKKSQKAAEMHFASSLKDGSTFFSKQWIESYFPLHVSEYFFVKSDKLLENHLRKFVQKTF